MAIPFVMINLDRPRQLRFGMKAMVEFEQLTGIKLMEIGNEMSMDTCSKLLWVMLRQEDKTLPLDTTLDLIDKYADNISDVMEAVTGALNAAFKTDGSIPNVGKPKK